MVQTPEEGRAVFLRLDAVCKRFLDLTPTYAGHVDNDQRVPQAVRKRRPFVLESPSCPASICIGQLAHRMDRLAAEPRRQGLMEKVAEAGRAEGGAAVRSAGVSGVHFLAEFL